MGGVLAALSGAAFPCENRRTLLISDEVLNANLISLAIEAVRYLCMFFFVAKLSYNCFTEVIRLSTWFKASDIPTCTA